MFAELPVMKGEMQFGFEEAELQPCLQTDLGSQPNLLLMAL